MDENQNQNPNGEDFADFRNLTPAAVAQQNAPAKAEAISPPRVMSKRTQQAIAIFALLFFLAVLSFLTYRIMYPPPPTFPPNFGAPAV